MGGVRRNFVGERPILSPYVYISFSFCDTQAEIEDCIKKIQGHKGVTGVIILNNEGIPLKTTMDHDTTIHATSLVHGLVNKARSTVRELDSSNELTFLRLRSRKHEIMCAPGKTFSLSLSVPL